MKTIGVRNISMYINMGMYNGRLVLPLQSEWTSKTCKPTATSDTSSVALEFIAIVEAILDRFSGGRCRN